MPNSHFLSPFLGDKFTIQRFAASVRMTGSSGKRQVESELDKEEELEVEVSNGMLHTFSIAG